MKVADKAGLTPDYEIENPIQVWHEDHEGITVKWWNEGDRPSIKVPFGNNGIIISQPDVTITGFDVYTDNAVAGNVGAAIYIDDGAENCTLTDNRCGFDNTHDWECGIKVEQVTNATLNNNSCQYNLYGIYLWFEAEDNTITNNTVSNNSSHGIYIYNSNNNNVNDNTCNDNSGMNIYSNNSTSLQATLYG